RWPRFRFQMEHGLDARHVEVLPDRPALPCGQSQRAYVWPALRMERELHPAVLARRSGPHERLAPEQDARHRRAEVCDLARALRLHVGASRKEVAVYGRRVW